MPARLTPTRMADDVIEFATATPREAQQLANTLRETLQAEDVVAGLDRVSVRFHPSSADHVTNALADMAVPEIDREASAPPIEIDIKYGGDHGPDLSFVADHLGLAVDAFVKTHTAMTHTVEMIGFTPGFSYISGLPDKYAVPRLAAPRPRVLAGSIGVTAGYTGIYALDGPGGWPLIGKTEAALFQAHREAPFLLTPGQRVKFRAV